MAIFPIQSLSYPYHISTVFASPALDSNGRLNGVLSSPKPDNDLAFNTEMLDNLQVVDYRYSRFALDPRTGLFSMIR